METWEAGSFEHHDKMLLKKDYAEKEFAVPCTQPDMDLYFKRQSL
jgi:hypothetical protein